MGAIVGSIAAGFWVIPALGFEATVALTASVNLLLATLVAVTVVAPPARALASAALAGIAVLGLVQLPTPWQVLATSPLAASGGSASKGSGDLLAGSEPFDVGDVRYLGVGRSATVMLLRRPWGWKLSTNGLPESAFFRPETPRLGLHTVWLGLLPSLARPEARELVLHHRHGELSVDDDVEVARVDPPFDQDRAALDRLRGPGIDDPLEVGVLELAQDVEHLSHRNLPECGV